MDLVPKCVLNQAMFSLQRCLPCIYVINVVTSTSMQTRLRDNADFSSCSAVILMPCKHVATERFMHNLRNYSKGVLETWLCTIHQWSWLQLWISLAFHFRALLLLQNVPGRLFTCYSIWPRLLQLILACYELVLASCHPLELFQFVTYSFLTHPEYVRSCFSISFHRRPSFQLPLSKLSRCFVQVFCNQLSISLFFCI